MPERVEALVEPSLLIWTREKAGLTVEMAAAKAHVTPERLAAWEGGEARPTIPQLRELGRVYKRPIAVFYLAEPPRDFPAISDYRVAWEEDRKPPSPELVTEIESTHVRREIALELLADEEQRPVFRLRADVDEDPNIVAARVRTALSIDIDEQATWRDSRVAFNSWRAAAEALGVLVVQMTTVEQREARGFSIAATSLPVVVANIRDPPGARSFTIVHELAHVAARQGGICDLNARGGRIEPFCNHVAGAVLVPAASLTSHEVVRAHALGDVAWADEELERLSRDYSVSREVVLRRLLILGQTDEAFYRKKRRELLAEYERRAEGAEQKWGPSPATLAVARAGHTFTRLVLSRYRAGTITASDVSVFLNVRMKHIPRIEQTVFPDGGGA